MVDHSNLMENWYFIAEKRENLERSNRITQFIFGSGIVIRKTNQNKYSLRGQRLRKLRQISSKHEQSLMSTEEEEREVAWERCCVQL